MQRRKIHNTSVELTELGFGASVIGNLYRTTPAADATAAIDAASALDDVMPAAQQHGKSVVAVGVFNSGLLSREWPAEGMKYDYQDAPPELVARARAIAEVCKGHGTTLPAAAIAFPTTHPSTVNVTLGMRDRSQVTRNAELQRSAVPPDLWDDLRCQGLIRPDVPTTSGIQGTADRPAPDGRPAALGDGTRGASF